MNLKWPCLLLTCLIVNVATAAVPAGSISSIAIGIYEPSEKRLLAPAFINSVNAWLHRYGPNLLAREEERVKMQVDYDYLYDIELLIKADEYEIRVTLAQKLFTKTGVPTARKHAAKLAAGILRAMEDELMRSGRGRSRVQ